MDVDSSGLDLSNDSNIEALLLFFQELKRNIPFKFWKKQVLSDANNQKYVFFTYKRLMNTLPALLKTIGLLLYQINKILVVYIVQMKQIDDITIRPVKILIQEKCRQNIWHNHNFFTTLFPLGVILRRGRYRMEAAGKSRLWINQY